MTKLSEIHTLRLVPEQDLKAEIEKFVQERKIRAGVILTCVGSLKQATIRLADESVTKTFNEKFEITGLSGTLSADGNHIHITLANKKGIAIGGHLKENCIIYSTAEIVIGELDNIEYIREFDKITGFRELKVSSH
ncbi:DNA-binding protein [Candidatus Woesearchaeota archaeon CG10_big_fil_rev_8_21_14_0_10_37_12]|nr:MAG: DNA-binding protein [Candidatus Woesearchaeota archaeon CG10_big_fil_rev_8_21_14_0_10_37_12]